jgi:polysaccharide pyruvyl transferase WcaK-like protein
MHIGLCGFYGKANFGDDLMADHLPRVLSVNGQHTVTLFSDCDRESIRNGKTSGAHLEQDVVVIGGGGVISPSFWALEPRFLERLIQRQTPVAFVNVNVTEDLLRHPSLVELLLQLNARWWVRDQHSCDNLARAGIDSALVPDVSFRSGVVPPRVMVKDRKKLLVFANAYLLNQLFQHQDTHRYLSAHEAAFTLAHFLDWMAHFQWEIHLVPAQTGGEFDDRIVGGMIYGLMRRKDAARWHSDAPDWNALIHEISHADLVLSMRYHASTTAIAAGTPLIDVTHHAKNRQLLIELGLESVAVAYDSLSQQALVAAAQCSSAMRSTTIEAYLQNADRAWGQFDKEWAEWLSTTAQEGA